MISSYQSLQPYILKGFTIKLLVQLFANMSHLLHPLTTLCINNLKNSPFNASLCFTRIKTSLQPNSPHDTMSYNALNSSLQTFYFLLCHVHLIFLFHSLTGWGQQASLSFGPCILKIRHFLFLSLCGCTFYGQVSLKLDKNLVPNRANIITPMACLLISKVDKVRLWQDNSKEKAQKS